MRRPRMPREIRLPFGWRIAVRYKTEAQLRALGLGMCHGSWLANAGAAPDKDGFLGTIYINRNDHCGEQCETIAHELEHAVTDYREWVDKTLRLPLQMESAETQYELAEDDELDE